MSEDQELIQPEEEKPADQRRGATGVWTFVLKAPDGHIVARSEWGTNYDFAVKQWEALPLV